MLVDLEQPLCRETVCQVLKWEIQHLLQRLSAVGEESVVLTADVRRDQCCHLASDRCSSFLEGAELQDVHTQFINFCKGIAEEDGYTDGTQSSPGPPVDTQSIDNADTGEIPSRPKSRGCSARKRKRSKRKRKRKHGDPQDTTCDDQSTTGFRDMVNAGSSKSPTKITIQTDMKEIKTATKRRKHAPVKAALCYHDDAESDSTDTSQHSTPSLPSALVTSDPSTADPGTIIQGDNSGTTFEERNSVHEGDNVCTGSMEGNSVNTFKGGNDGANSMRGHNSGNMLQGSNYTHDGADVSMLRGSNSDIDNDVCDTGVSLSRGDKMNINQTNTNSVNFSACIRPRSRRLKRLGNKFTAYKSVYTLASDVTNSHSQPSIQDTVDVDVTFSEFTDAPSATNSLSDSDVPTMALPRELGAQCDDMWAGTPTTVMEPDGTMKVITVSMPPGLQEVGEGGRVSHRRAGGGFKAAPTDEDPNITELLDLSKRGVRQYQCPYCDLMVRDRHDLKRHLRTHTKEKPYPCRLCSRKFTRRWDLINHLRRFHDEPDSFWETDSHYDAKSMMDAAELDVDLDCVKQEVDQSMLTGNQSVYSYNQSMDNGSQPDVIFSSEENGAGTQELQTGLVYKKMVSLLYGDKVTENGAEKFYENNCDVEETIDTGKQFSVQQGNTE